MSARRPPRRTEDHVADLLPFPFSNGSISATTGPLKLFKVPAGREAKVESVAYFNATGLVGDNTNNFRCEVKKGGTVAALVFNTDTNDAPAGVSLPVAAWVDGSLSATDADSWFAEGDSVDVLFTLEGTQTLPAGNGVVLVRLY